MGGFGSKKSEKLQSGIWSDLEEPPVDGWTLWNYVVIFYGTETHGSHYYFGGRTTGYSVQLLSSILRLESGSWTWSNVGRIKSARMGHAVILVGEKFIVVGGEGNHNNEACLLNNYEFSCTKLSSSLTNYANSPILFSVADNYINC